MSLFGLFPPTFFIAPKEGRGWNGTHNPFRILIERGPRQAAIYAQEKWEWPRLILRQFLPGYNRKCEIFSHEITVQAAVLLYGEDEAAYRKWVAEGLLAYDFLYDAFFENGGAAELEQRMAATKTRASRWVESHRALLARAKVF